MQRSQSWRRQPSISPRRPTRRSATRRRSTFSIRHRATAQKWPALLHRPQWCRPAHYRKRGAQQAFSHPQTPTSTRRRVSLPSAVDCYRCSNHARSHSPHRCAAADAGWECKQSGHAWLWHTRQSQPVAAGASCHAQLQQPRRTRAADGPMLAFPCWTDRESQAGAEQALHPAHQLVIDVLRSAGLPVAPALLQGLCVRCYYF